MKIPTHCFALISTAYAAFPDICSFSANQTIIKDVAVIGGGPSGTYAAVNLRDNGTNVIVIEKQHVLGGNVHTYTIPETGMGLEYGVHAFEDAPTLRSFFSRFGLSLMPYIAQPPGPTVYADFASGQKLNFTPPTPDWQPFSKQRERYPFLQSTIDFPRPIPADLYLPFRDFVTKYGLEDDVFAIYVAGQGLGALLDIPTLYVLQYFDPDYTMSVEGINNTAYIPTDHGNQEVFRRAQLELGSDVLYGSMVVSAQRNASGVSLVVDTPSGRKLVKAKKLLISIRPTVNNLTPFSLDGVETRLFSQFGFTGWYVGLINNTGLEDGITYQNVGRETSYNLSPLPGVYTLSPTAAPGTFWVRYGSDDSQNLPDSVVKSDIVATVKRLRDQNAGSNATGDPNFLAYSSHTPFQLMVPSHAIRDGFYENLNSLQGYRNTYYTGVTFITAHFTAVLNLTQQILPSLQ